MAELTGKRIAVVGAGVFGLCTALRCAAADAEVEVWDPAAPGDNASGVAAGMIAPVSEALLEHADDARLRLFLAGADGWKTLQALAPTLSIERAGALLLFNDDAAHDAASSRLRALGVEVTPSPAGFAPPGVPNLFVADDWSIDASSALTTLRTAVVAHGGVIRTKAYSPLQASEADSVIVAAGYGARSFLTLAPELAALIPIKGQIVRFQGAPAHGPVLRGPDIYLSPQLGGLLAGATMETGRADRTVEPDVIADLRARAVALLPELEPLAFTGLTGVRAATPDGLPLAGPSSRPGVFLAVGARRNGWLLAPLVSEILVSYLSGGDGGPFATALDPRRALHA